MKIRVYQINPDRDEHRIMFLSHDRLARSQGSQEVNSSIYDKVYDKDVPCSNLEEVYAMLNINHPSDYRGRSLSVSDIVEVCKAEAVTQGFYFCDSVGFRQVAFHPEECGVSEWMNEESAKLSVLLVEPGKYPQMVEMEDSLEAMQRIVGGDIEEFMPYVDEVAIICNDEGKMNGQPPNRAIYFEPEGAESREMVDIIFGTFFICYALQKVKNFSVCRKNWRRNMRQNSNFRRDFSDRVTRSLRCHMSHPDRKMERSMNANEYDHTAITS